MSKRSLLKFSEQVWDEQGWSARHSAPEIVVVPNTRVISACWGRGYIELRAADCHPSIVLHELVHARGYGAGVQEHPVSFVLKVIELYAYYLGWSYYRLFAQAALRRLV